MFRKAPATRVEGARQTQGSKAQWTAADIPDQTDRVAIITGANTGVGFETASALAGHGARVVLAVRNLDKGKAAWSSERHWGRRWGGGDSCARGASAHTRPECDRV